jgi:cell division protein FtsI/penicillin-binding protein 2
MGGGRRLLHVVLVFVAIAVAIGRRLVTLQFEQREFWEEEAVLARTRAQPIGFRRGAILDRSGRALAWHRPTWNLAFVFTEFRKGTACGQLLLSHYLLTGRRVSLAAVAARPEPRIDELCALTVGELRRIEPGQRREDLLWYAAWLEGAETIKSSIDRLRGADATAPMFPELLGSRGALAAKARGEVAALELLSRALELDGDGEAGLVARIDEAILAIDARVARKLADDDPAGRAYERERELHREHDARDFLLARGLAHAVAIDLAADPGRLPGFVVREEARRVHPEENDVAAPLVGRVGPPSEAAIREFLDRQDRRDLLALEPFRTLEQSAELAELEESLRLDVVLPDEEIGRDGLELAFEPILRGRRGYRQTENDRSGRVERELGLVAPRAGQDVVLTLDVAWQRAAEAILRRGVRKANADGTVRREWHPAALVLLELPTMAIRVLASTPSPSREALTLDWKALAEDTRDRPLHPRAWRPWLPPPPGSSVKPLVAAFALSEGLIGPGTRLECDHDQLRAAGESRPVLCEGRHHQIDVHDALVKSCNHYFARVAAAAKSDTMVGWLRAVGLGRPTGFASARLADGREFGVATGEAAGTAAQESGGRNLMLLGLGQGKVDATPLQMAAAMGALAQRGWQPPVLIERVGDEEPFRPAIEPLPITDAAFQCVVEAMRGVTLPGGTADPRHGYDLTGFDLATKTGTPQQAGGPSHSWLVGFFPSRAPRYAFSIFVERTGMHGGDASGPFLHDLLTDPAFAELAAGASLGIADAAAARLAVEAARDGDDDAFEASQDGDPEEGDAR